MAGQRPTPGTRSATSHEHDTPAGAATTSAPGATAEPNTAEGAPGQTADHDVGRNPDVVIDAAMAGRGVPGPAPEPSYTDLLPLDPPEGSGQNLSRAQRLGHTNREQLEEARKEADRIHREAQLNIRRASIELAEDDLRAQREEAMAEVDDNDRSSRSIFERFPGGAQVVHPQWLEMEAARVRAVAGALQQDETVPGGVYIVDGKRVDADGNPLE